jgi:hypothetical protein
VRVQAGDYISDRKFKSNSKLLDIFFDESCLDFVFDFLFEKECQ